jgi:glycosyltransferase involved in cell wall biosynthesis
MRRESEDLWRGCFFIILRMWDVRTANGVDVFVAISNFIAQRIWKIYRREARVIYPPVDIASFTVERRRKAFYLTVSRLVPYKRIDLIIDAFSQLPDQQLVVIGDGPELSRLRSKAKSNITMLGFQPFEVIREHMQQARAFVFAAEEDFGIAPLEAQACGTPVIAFGGGGVTETVIDGETGIYFMERTAESLINAINRFESDSFYPNPDRIRQNAERFSIERFRHEFAELVEREYSIFTDHGPRPHWESASERWENGKGAQNHTADSPNRSRDVLAGAATLGVSAKSAPQPGK